ncbi:BrnA antitoxin family protein [Sphingomonas sp. TF3]|nr:BrnA antitoxin family protein [Sphingomonas sp. TF3]
MIERFRPDGPGWQGRMNAALRKTGGCGVRPSSRRV